jgi:hypothetical protein
MDRLTGTEFLEQLTGDIFLSQKRAMDQLTPLT